MPLVGDRQCLELNGKHGAELKSLTRNLQHLGVFVSVRKQL